MAYFWRGLSTEGNLRFKIEWASLIVGSKSTVLALLYFIFEGNFPSTSPRGAYIWRGDLTEDFCVTGLGGLYMEELIFGILRNASKNHQKGYFGYCSLMKFVSYLLHRNICIHV